MYNMENVSMLDMDFLTRPVTVEYTVKYLEVDETLRKNEAELISQIDQLGRDINALKNKRQSEVLRLNTATTYRGTIWGSGCDWSQMIGGEKFRSTKCGSDNYIKTNYDNATKEMKAATNEIASIDSRIATLNNQITELKRRLALMG